MLNRLLRQRRIAIGDLKHFRGWLKLSLSYLNVYPNDRKVDLSAQDFLMAAGDITFRRQW